MEILKFGLPVEFSNEQLSTLFETFIETHIRVDSLFREKFAERIKEETWIKNLSSDNPFEKEIARRSYESLKKENFKSITIEPLPLEKIDEMFSAAVASRGLNP